jgi:hypothetical protein
MKTPVINHSSPWVTFLCLLLGIQLRAAQFVELTAEIETVDWHSEAVSRQPPWTVRCVVGANAWRIDGRFVRQGNSTWSFTGTNLVERTVYGDASGTQRSQTFESVDGNPGRPARTQDLMLLPTAKIAWLALCSGPCLKAEGRRLFPPSDLWKELVDALRLFEQNRGVLRRLGTARKRKALSDQPNAHSSVSRPELNECVGLAVSAGVFHL